VAVDLRKNSKTFGKYYGIELTEENKLMFYIPEGFAHGYLALTQEVEFLYKATNYYSPEYESGIIWNDEDINIKWPFEKYGIKKEELILSEKDKKLQRFKEYIGEIQ
jgi:dTDP-4-dehydrorhamnose 3,5-epimerase